MSQNDLAKKQCIPCRGNIPPLQGEELEALYLQLKKGWTLIEEHHLEKEFKYDINFTTVSSLPFRYSDLYHS